MDIDGEHLADDLALEGLTAARRIARDGSGRAVRQASGASLAEIGRAVGVSKATVCKWERGQLTPSGARGVKYLLIIKALAAGSA
jgi:DNA-binding transcriptional regulator YiaG